MFQNVNNVQENFTRKCIKRKSKEFQSCILHVSTDLTAAMWSHISVKTSQFPLHRLDSIQGTDYIAT